MGITIWGKRVLRKRVSSIARHLQNARILQVRLGNKNRNCKYYPQKPISVFASPKLAILHLEAENLSKVVDAKSSLEADNGTASGSVEVGVDSVQVNALGNHGDGLTNDLDDVVQAKGIGSLSADAVNKADELGGQGGGSGKSTLDLENKLFSIVYQGMSD